MRVMSWHPTPPPPNPKIINLPTKHGTRRKKNQPTVAKQPTTTTTASGTIQTYNYKGKLESLFGVEREFTRAPVVLLNSDERRERVGSEEEVEDSVFWSLIDFLCFDGQGGGGAGGLCSTRGGGGGIAGASPVGGGGGIAT